MDVVLDTTAIANDEADADEILFDFVQSQHSDEPTWDPSDQVSDDDILHEFFDDSQPFSIAELEEDCDNETGSSTVPDSKWIIERIEDILENVIDGLLAENGRLTINLKSRSGLSRRHFNPSEDTGTIPLPRTQELTYPGNNAQDARRFTVVVRILELIHGSLVGNTIMTKRDIYYRHPDLFGKQSVVDRYVDDIACTLGVSRSLLNVTATAKGLIAGNFFIQRVNGISLHGLSETEGVLVPKLSDNERLDLSYVQWILVIEKEATFRSLLSSPQWKVLSTHGLVLTAKGYPDLASRKFLRQVTDDFPHLPMLALVDLDPDGIAIMSTYKHGSFRLAHEGTTHTDTPGLNLANLQWLGVQSHHINRSPGNECDTTTAAPTGLQAVMKLTARDRRKAHQMLEWDICGEHGCEPAWRAELQRMLMLNIKAEMQILDELPGGLVSWLSNQLEVMQGLGADDEIIF